MLNQWIQLCEHLDVQRGAVPLSHLSGRGKQSNWMVHGQFLLFQQQHCNTEGAHTTNQIQYHIPIYVCSFLTMKWTCLSVIHYFPECLCQLCELVKGWQLLPLTKGRFFQFSSGNTWNCCMKRCKPSTCEQAYVIIFKKVKNFTSFNMTSPRKMMSSSFTWTWQNIYNALRKSSFSWEFCKLQRSQRCDLSRNI